MAPKFTKDSAGGDAWLFAGEAEPDPIGLVATPGMAWDQFRWMGVTYEEARTGCYNGAERLKDMTHDGIHAALNFAPQRTMGHFLATRTTTSSPPASSAFNSFLIDEFCAPDHAHDSLGPADAPRRRRERGRDPRKAAVGASKGS